MPQICRFVPLAVYNFNALEYGGISTHCALKCHLKPLSGPLSWLPYPLVRPIKEQQCPGRRGFRNRTWSRFYHPPLCRENIEAPQASLPLEAPPFPSPSVFLLPNAQFQWKALRCRTDCARLGLDAAVSTTSSACSRPRGSSPRDGHGPPRYRVGRAPLLGLVTKALCITS